MKFDLWLAVDYHAYTTSVLTGAAYPLMTSQDWMENSSVQYLISHRWFKLFCQHGDFISILTQLWRITFPDMIDRSSSASYRATTKPVFISTTLHISSSISSCALFYINTGSASYMYMYNLHCQSQSYPDQNLNGHLCQLKAIKVEFLLPYYSPHYTASC